MIFEEIGSICLKEAQRRNFLFGVHRSGWLLQLGILIIFFLIVYWMLHGNKKNESAMEILKKRYVQGEITKKQFLEIKKEIS